MRSAKFCIVLYANFLKIMNFRIWMLNFVSMHILHISKKNYKISHMLAYYYLNLGLVWYFDRHCRRLCYFKQNTVEIQIPDNQSPDWSDPDFTYPLPSLSNFLLGNIISEKDDERLQNSSRTFRTIWDAKKINFFLRKIDISVWSNRQSLCRPFGQMWV